ncbi:hypothetical protein LTR10_004114 [Elasticomyces elasticus]|nr:hypothetical protein LTR10_004114 [Elasticomyces elasticus]
MDQVYGHAFCNIAATASSDGSFGLFRDRDPAVCHRLELDASFTDFDPMGRQRRFTVTNADFLDAELYSAPLNKRGWVLQERMLAKRTLHFTRNEVMWDCRACGPLSETYPFGVPTPSGRLYIQESLKLGPESLTKISGDAMIAESPRGTFHRLWTAIQDSYSRCYLTNSEDRLPALSGLAKKMRGLTGDTYVAGMWLHRIEEQLLWVAPQPMHGTWSAKAINKEQPGIWQAPSWSWASINASTRGADLMWSKLPKLLITVARVHIAGVTGDTTGRLRTASLHLHGTLKNIRVRPNADRTLWEIHVKERRLQYEDSHIQMYGDIPVFDLESLDSTLFYAPVREKDRQLEFGTLECLLLQLVDRYTATYRRVGVMECWDRATNELLMETQLGEDKIPCLHYDAHSDALHEVLLI